jgi:hypothetical protein
MPCGALVQIASPLDLGNLDPCRDATSLDLRSFLDYDADHIRYHVRSHARSGLIEFTARSRCTQWPFHASVGTATISRLNPRPEDLGRANGVEGPH